MAAPDPREMLAPYLQPWHVAIADPEAAQAAVLHRNLKSTPRRATAKSTVRAMSGR